MEQRAANLVAQRAEPVLRLLKTIVLSLHENPTDPRYRRLPYSTNRKLRSVLDKSSDGQAFLMALGYRLDRMGDLTLDLHGRTANVMRPLYFSALSILSQSLERLAAMPAPREVALDHSLPAQPAEGAAGTTAVSVRFVKGGPGLHGTVVSRRFDAGDTLRDVMTLVEGSIGIAGPQHGAAGSVAAPDHPEYQLVDRTQRNRTFAADVANSTLQSLGLWPIANLTAVVRDVTSEVEAARGVDSAETEAPVQRSSERPLPSELLNAHKSRHEAFSSKRVLGSAHSIKRAQVAAAAERRARQDGVIASLVQEAKAKEAAQRGTAAEKKEAAEAERPAGVAAERRTLEREFENEASQMQEARA